MSFSWANKLAKNALLTAQKHIDSVLDIKNDEDTPEYSTETDNEETYEENESKEDTEEFRTESESDVASYVDIELSVNTTQSSDWSTEFEQKNTPVVDSEPNPIRDAHEDAITPLNFSPTSNTNTPEEDGSDGTHNEIDNNNPASSSIDLSLINESTRRSNSLRSVASEGRQCMPDALSEDMNTIASSDIEVVKQLDNWSVSSSHHWRHANDMSGIMGTSMLPDSDLLNSLVTNSVSNAAAGNVPSTSLGQIAMTNLSAVVDADSAEFDAQLVSRVQEAKASRANKCSVSRSKSTSTDDGTPNDDLQERVVVLEAKLCHKEQQMEEVVKQNEKLRLSNSNLAAKNKQMSNRLSAESKLQKQLTDKEKALSDLMDEGKRLSEHSGKQAREIRKLKNQLSQLNTVEAARDSALSELQASHRTLQEYARESEELKESLKEAQATIKELKTESELNRASTDIVEKFMSEKSAEIETLTKDLQHTRDELKSATKTKTQLLEELQAVNLKLMSRRANDSAESDRERGAFEDLAAERARNAVLSAQVNQLELKNEMLMRSQQDIASLISEANLPLLNNISALEEKVCVLERQKDALSSQLRAANEAGERQKRDAEAQLRIVVQRLDEAHGSSMSKDTELTRYAAEKRMLKSDMEKLENELRTTRTDTARKCREMDEKNAQLAAELRAKQSSYESLERQYVDLLKSSMRPTAVKEASTKLSSPQREVWSSTKLENLEEEEDDDGEDADLSKSSTMSRQRREVLPRYNNDRSMLAEEMNVVLTSDESKSLWHKGFTAQTSQMDSLISQTKSRTPSVRPNAQSDSFKQSVSAEFLRNELEDAHEQLYQLREKFDRLLELYGGCLENIDELKYDNEDLRKLCKEQAIELSDLKSESRMT